MGQREVEEGSSAMLSTGLAEPLLVEGPMTRSDVGRYKVDHEVCNEGENVGDNVPAVMVMV